jgi:hypothetical protein
MVAQTKPSPAEAAAAPAARERKTTPIQAVRGMNDVLPDEAPLWQRFEDAVREVFGQYGYRNLRVPVVERRCSCARSAKSPTWSSTRCTRSRIG